MEIGDQKDNVILSVCLITYQDANYIEKCLDSVLGQKTDFNFKVIIGEDASSDGTREICLNYAKKYPERIQLLLGKRENVIYIEGRPTGRYNFVKTLEQAKSKYVALIEGDDYWTDPLKLQKQVDFLESNPEYSICFHPVEVYDQSQEKMVKDVLTATVKDTTSVYDLAKGNYIHTCSVMYRNNLFRSFPGYFFQAPIGDYFLHMLNAKYGPIKMLNEEMAVYRLHNASHWSSLQQEKRYRSWYAFLLKLRENFDKKTRSILTNQAVELGLKMFSINKAKNFTYLLRTFVLSPKTVLRFFYSRITKRLNT